MFSDVPKAKADNTSKGFFIFLIIKLSIKSISQVIKNKFYRWLVDGGKNREKYIQNTKNQIYYLVSEME
jgi:hypothetical protein